MIAETSAVATVGVCLHLSAQGVWFVLLFVLHRSLRVRPKAEARARRITQQLEAE